MREQAQILAMFCADSTSIAPRGEGRGGGGWPGLFALKVLNLPLALLIALPHAAGGGICCVLPSMVPNRVQTVDGTSEATHSHVLSRRFLALCQWNVGAGAKRRLMAVRA